MNAYLFQPDFSVLCQPVVDNTDYAFKRCVLTYFFYISKMIDFGDTIFFVIRKKTAETSFLHVYYHIVNYIVMYMAVKTIPTAGQAGLITILNSLIHVMMYYYYFISSLNPNDKSHIWWKKHITQAQIVN